MIRFTHPALPAVAVTLAAALLGACGKQAPAPPLAPPPARTVRTAVPVAPPPAVAVNPEVTDGSVPTATAAPTAAASTRSVPAADAAFKVVQVQLGDLVTADFRISQVKTTFAPTQDSIYASVSTTGRARGATLSASWSYLDSVALNGKEQAISTVSQSVVTDGPANTAFKLSNPNHWPQGKYKVEISIDGKPVTSQTFVVKAAI